MGSKPNGYTFLSSIILPRNINGLDLIGIVLLFLESNGKLSEMYRNKKIPNMDISSEIIHD